MNPPERLNGWAKALALFIPFLIAGLIAWGTMRSNVEHLQAADATHVSRELVNQQYAEVLRRLERIDARLDRMEDK